MEDLTHPLTDGMPVHPGDPPVDVRSYATVADDGYRVTELSTGTHAGTHVEAPAHVLADGETLAAYPVETFVFDALVVDCTDAGPGDAVTPEDLPSPAGPELDLLVVRTGWDAHWGTERYAEHPYLSPEAAAACAAADLHVGVDAPSVDPQGGAGGQGGAAYPAHRELFEEGALVVENLRNLDGVPRRTHVYAFPLRLDAEASPVRAVADPSNQRGDSREE